MAEALRRMAMFHYPAHPGGAGGITWAYQRRGDEPERAVVDFTDAIAPCALCGAAGYFAPVADGHGAYWLAVRWHCGHTIEDGAEE